MPPSATDSDSKVKLISIDPPGIDAGTSKTPQVQSRGAASTNLSPISGVGKTTLVKKITSILKDKGVNMSGFYTEEVKKDKVREGFDVVSLDGTRGRLARDRRILCRRERVGKYSVIIEEFEETAMPTLAGAATESSQTHLVVIDEIGKMECLSAKFIEKIKEIFNSGDTVVLATIPVQDSDPIMRIIRNHNLSKLWVVTRENRDNILEDIAKKIECTLNTQ